MHRAILLDGSGESVIWAYDFPVMFLGDGKCVGFGAENGACSGVWGGSTTPGDCLEYTVKNVKTPPPCKKIEIPDNSCLFYAKKQT